MLISMYTMVFDAINMLNDDTFDEAVHVYKWR